MAQTEQVSQRQLRMAWKKGSEVQVFSNSDQSWYAAKVMAISHDDEGEWLECHYSCANGDKRKKQVQRLGDDVRPVKRRRKSEQKQELETTLALIKPDLFGDIDRVFDHYILPWGVRVLDMKHVQLTETRAEAFFAKHKGQIYFNKVIAHMTSGSVFALKLQDHNAIKLWRAMVGPKNPMHNDQETLRGRGESIIKNCAHGSASKTAAARELDFFFDCEQTLALIKPDAVAAGKADAIVAIIECEGFMVMERAQLTLSKQRAEEFYAEHKDKHAFDELIAFMTSGEVVALRLEKKNAIQAWDELMGPDDFKTAQKRAPRSIRALFGSSTMKNAVHGSDSLRSAVRELTFFFPQQETLALLKPAAYHSGHWYKIMQRIVDEGFTVIEVKREQFSRERAEAFCAEHKESACFAEMIDGMMGTGTYMANTSIAFRLRAPNAVAKWRALMGPTDLEEAKKRAPDSLNAKYSKSTFKNAAHGSDSAESAKRELEFFFPSKSNKARATKQYTLALIKPDAVASGVAQEIVNRTAHEGFAVREQHQMRLSKERAEQFYAEHKGRDYFDELIAFMTSGDVVVLKLEREDAVNRWRAVMGPTDCEEARKDSPRSVRAMFATSVVKNAVHGSISSESAKRELDFFFAQ